MIRASKWIWSAVAILLCLTLFSFHLTGGLFARYTAQATGSDFARVAKFDVDVIGPADMAVTCTQSANGQYVLDIQNHSEVTVQYRVEVTPQTDALNNIVTVEVDPGTATLAPNGASATVTLSFLLDTDAFTKEYASGDQLSATAEMEYSIHVYTEQVD